MSLDPETIAQAQARWISCRDQDGAAIEKVARSCMPGLRAALERLQHNLQQIDYPVAELVLPCREGMEARIAAMTEACGAAPPPILCLIWEEIGGLCFVDYKDYAHADFWDDRGIGGPEGFCDALALQPLTDLWRYSVDTEEEGGRIEPVFQFSPDGYHKDDISGGMPYSVALGEGWFAPVREFRWAGKSRPPNAPEPLDLLSYLRISLLEGAGFPALLGADGFEPVRRKLLEGVPVF